MKDTEKIDLCKKIIDDYWDIVSSEKSASEMALMAVEDILMYEEPCTCEGSSEK